MATSEASGFVCATCGLTHAGLPKDWAYQLPDDVWAIPESDRANRATWSDDFCELDGRLFLRCVLLIPLVDSHDHFCWGVWVEVESPVFARYREIYDRDGSGEPLASGILANKIPCYEVAAGARVFVAFGTAAERPTITLDPNSTSSLARDQRDGIDSARYHEILAAIEAT